MDDANNIKLSPNRWAKHSDLAIAMALMGTLLVMVTPIPPMLMDLLFVISLTGAISIMLLSVYSTKPLDFSVFPTVLLFSTLLRLSLNVASSRLILLNGHSGSAAAGQVIETFGEFVVGGNYIVGAVIFLLLIIINFVVITRGAGRVAEVAARFVLDAMPGKQMSIEADLNAGLLSEDQARERRAKIEQEADFYGAMDGASKFVRGDAIAGILITLINIIGGLAIGVFQKGLPAGKAAEIYTLMTIGDGLITQIPALIVSTAAGVIVTRAASGNNLSKEITNQIMVQPRAIGITGAILIFIGILPGMPAAPFLLVGITLSVGSYFLSQHQETEAKAKIDSEQKAAEKEAAETHVPPTVDVLELQVGYGLVKLVDENKNGDLVERIYQLRKEFAKDLGIIVPKVRIKDNLELSPSEYQVMIKGIKVGGGNLMLGHLLAMDPGNVEEKINGAETTEPVFGLAALWISEDQREKAQIAGYTVVDESTVIATHLSEIIRQHAYELLGRQELQTLIENVTKTHPKVVEELIPKPLPLGSVLKVAQNLLKEQVPIRDILTVLETLANHATQTTDTTELTEFVRAALARTITDRLTVGTNKLEFITLEPAVESKLLQGCQRIENGGTRLNIESGYLEALVNGLRQKLGQTVFNSGIPVLLCHPLFRAELRRLVGRFIPNLSIISPNEVVPNVDGKNLASVGV